MPATLPKAKLADIQADRRHASSEFRILVTRFSDPDQIDEATEAYGDWPPDEEEDVE